MVIFKNDKKGSSHLETVLSFSLFILFTIFLVVFIRPPEETKLTNILLEDLSKSFENYTSTEVISFVIKPNSTNCTNLSLSGISIYGNSSVRDFIGIQTYNGIGGVPVVNSTGYLNSSFSNGVLVINSSSLQPLEVFISDEFNGSSYNCVNSSNSSVGSINRERMISYKKFSSFLTEYNRSYSDLKNKLHLPIGTEFAVNSSGLIEAERAHPQEVDVRSKEVFYNIVFSNGEIKRLGVVFKIW